MHASSTVATEGLCCVPRTQACRISRRTCATALCHVCGRLARADVLHYSARAPLAALIAARPGLEASFRRPAVCSPRFPTDGVVAAPVRLLPMTTRRAEGVAPEAGWAVGRDVAGGGLLLAASATATEPSGESPATLTASTASATLATSAASRASRPCVLIESPSFARLAIPSSS